MPSLDLKHFNGLTINKSGDGRVTIEVGAGCRVEDVLKHLRRNGYTLRAYGITGRQSMAGAVSTGTHGTGRSSMSHYVKAVRVAAYGAGDDGRSARCSDWPGPDDLPDHEPLRAARCGVGCMGVLLSLRVACEHAFSL